MGGLIKDRALLHVKGKISCKEEEEPKILADMLELSIDFAHYSFKGIFA